MKKITFQSKGKKLVGNLYYPESYEQGKKYTAIVVTGSWTTVKEQMAGEYAKRFSNEGFIALAYDPRNYGESEGDIMYYEDPSMKIEDVKKCCYIFRVTRRGRPCGCIWCLRWCRLYIGCSF